jgi:hypothetical protein
MIKIDKSPRRLEEALHRRLELCRAGFAYDVRQALWRRGRHLHFSDEQVDRFEPWVRYLRRWMATRPPRHRRPRARWRRPRRSNWLAALPPASLVRTLGDVARFYQEIGAQAGR